MVKIRLQRTGRRNRACFRIVVMDIRKKRQGKCLERVGHYDPLEPKEENKVQFNAERIRFWAEQGAQASETVEKLLKARGMSWGRVKSAEKVAATVASS